MTPRRALPGEIGYIVMTLDADAGTMTFTERFVQPSLNSVVCSSGPVSFGASVSRLRSDSEDRT